MSMNRDFHGFNTVSNSNIPRRERKARQQRVAILSAFAVLALMLIIGVAIIISSLSEGKKGGELESNDDKYENSELMDAAKDIVYASVTLSDADVKKGTLVLVDREHAYSFPEDNTHLARIFTVYSAHADAKPYILGISEFMEAEALVNMDKLLTEYYKQTGDDNIVLNEAYRTYEEQDKLSIPAGHSDHHTGLGCTLKIVGADDEKTDLNEDPEAYAWIVANAHKYGFVVRYPESKTEQTGIEGYEYYFRYVGVAHATYMKANDLCLEEYVELVKNYSYDGEHLRVLGYDGKTYEIYYAAVDGDTAVKCPTNYNYTASGTNEGGVIVTIDITQKVTAGDSEG
ncbi:MAG: D-alanyl-D-alanine carboxypeptidase family protein [Ruminococcaceae bacterium]|nr:D-alanyl-D-alanine carboxypeptidase family protein [Oscillospiraceae bacterium]